MESSQDIIKLSRELTRASILLEEYDRYLALKDKADMREATGALEGEETVREILSFKVLVSDAARVLEDVCQKEYGMSINELRHKISEGHAIVSLYEEDIMDFHKIKKAYEMIASANAFDESGEFPEDSEEAYKAGLEQLSTRLRTLSEQAFYFFPSHTK